MKWINGYTWEEKIRIWWDKIHQKELWHIWFAWYPVTVGVTSEQRKVKVWLRYVMRKGNYTSARYKRGHFDWKYKEII